MVRNQAAVVRDSPFSCFILYLISRKKVEPAPGGVIAISAPCVVTMDRFELRILAHTLCEVAKAKKQKNKTLLRATFHSETFRYYNIAVFQFSSQACCLYFTIKCLNGIPREKKKSET